MFRVQRSMDNDVVLALSGRVDSEDLADLKTLLDSETNGRHIVLDLANLTLVDRESVRFLERREAQDIEIRNCPGYIREWIARERNAG